MEGSKSVEFSLYRLKPKKNVFVQKEIQKMLNLDITEPSESPWASAIAPVLKSDGSGSLCTDYRKMNSLTIPNQFPSPRVDLTDRVEQAKFLSKIDMTRGYWHVPLDDSSLLISAFVTPAGFVQ